jgi:hypothetical protein
LTRGGRAGGGGDGWLTGNGVVIAVVITAFITAFITVDRDRAGAAAESGGHGRGEMEG